MITGGFIPLSLSDFPGTPAAVVFLQGCNWRCQYCHNPALLPIKQGKDHSPELLQQIKEQRKLIQGVVITGGEPTLQPDVLDFMQQIRETGLKVKLDTNGSNPAFLHRLIQREIIDYIAMDIKAPWEKYSSIIGKPVNIDSLKKSIHLISSSSIPHQFRTTFAPHLLTEKELNLLSGYIPNSSAHVINPYREVSVS